MQKLPVWQSFLSQEYILSWSLVFHTKKIFLNAKEVPQWNEWWNLIFREKNKPNVLRIKFKKNKCGKIQNEHENSS